MIVRPATKVYLDWDVLLDARMSFYTLDLQFLTHLVDSGIVEVLTTDLVMIEACTARARYDLLDIVDLASEHIRKTVKRCLGVNLPVLDRKQLWNVLEEKHRAEVSAIFTALKARQLALDETKPSMIFADYVGVRGFFDDSWHRENFANAFVFDCLKREASEQTPVIIASKDAVFEAPVKSEEHVSLVNSLPALFSALGLEVDRPDILEFLTTRQAEIIEVLNHKLEEWLFRKVDISEGGLDNYKIDSINFSDSIIFSKELFADQMLIIVDIETMGMMKFTQKDWNYPTYYGGLCRSYPLLGRSRIAKEGFPVKTAIHLSNYSQSDYYKIDGICIKSIDFCLNILESPEDMAGYDD